MGGGFGMQYGMMGQPIGMGPDIRTFGGGMGGMTQFGGGVRSQGPESLRMQQENLRMRQMQAALSQQTPQRGGGLGQIARIDRSRLFNQPLRTAI